MIEMSTNVSDSDEVEEISAVTGTGSRKRTVAPPEFNTTASKLYKTLAATVVAGNAQVMAAATAFLLESDTAYDDEDDVVDHRLFARGEKKVYDHVEIKQRLTKDYLGPTPLFDGKEFEVMFRISRPRFQRLMEDIAATGDLFYLRNVDAWGKVGACFEAKLLLPLKTMAYGVPPHCFRDYFQMSQTLARECCVNFDIKIRQIYETEYLRCPSAEDLKRINTLHKSVHNFDGMFGSLDCMHTYWKNCPIAWQGSFKGKEKKPSIVLEAIADYHLWFWHAAYGYAGSMNDISILAMSPFLESLVNGSFEEMEKSVVPYKIAGEEFYNMYVLVDGIYPPYSRFVKGFHEPIAPWEQGFTKWQEATRKDIERAFGVLQAKWQCLARPMYFIDLDNLGARVAACLILHNMCVSDRVMEGDVHAFYDPSHSVINANVDIENPPNLAQFQEAISQADRSEIGVATMSRDASRVMTRRDRWSKIRDTNENGRLHGAFKSAFENAGNK